MVGALVLGESQGPLALVTVKRDMSSSHVAAVWASAADHVGKSTWERSLNGTFSGHALQYVRELASFPCLGTWVWLRKEGFLEGWGEGWGKGWLGPSVNPGTCTRYVHDSGRVKDAFSWPLSCWMPRF